MHFASCDTIVHGIIVLAGIAYTAAMMEPEAANSTNTFSYQKVFSDDDFIASGVLALPVGGEKPMKGTKDNTYVRIYLCYFSGIAVDLKYSGFTGVLLLCGSCECYGP